jgi:hypothetical protein
MEGPVFLQHGWFMLILWQSPYRQRLGQQSSQHLGSLNVLLSFLTLTVVYCIAVRCAACMARTKHMRLLTVSYIDG